MMESQGGTQTMQQVIQSMQKENQLLQQQVNRVTKERNEQTTKLQQQLESGDSQKEGSNKDKEKAQNLEKQLSEMKSLILHKEQQAQLKEQAYNEVLSLCARYSKNDKALMTKLRELKFKHAEGGSTCNNGNNGMNTSITVPDEATGADQSSVQNNLIQENQNLKKELDFASSEIERLRAKLIIEDYDMPPLSSELFGSGKSHSFKLNESMDN